MYDATTSDTAARFARRHDFIDAICDRQLLQAHLGEVEQRLDTARAALESEDAEWLAEFDARQDDGDSRLGEEQIRLMLARMQAAAKRRA